MALPSRDYRDPLEILIERESQTCKGCIHEYRERVFSSVIAVCKLPRTSGRPRQHGTRCRDYSEGEK